MFVTVICWEKKNIQLWLESGCNMKSSKRVISYKCCSPSIHPLANGMGSLSHVSRFSFRLRVWVRRPRIKLQLECGWKEAAKGWGRWKVFREFIFILITALPPKKKVLYINSQIHCHPLYDPYPPQWLCHLL